MEGRKMVFREYFPCDLEADKKERVSSEEIKSIYEKMEDEESRRIFENRLMYSFTGDYEYIRRIVLNTSIGKKTDELLQGRIYIYGAGKRGRTLIESFPDKEWQGFIDANREGTYEGYPVQKFCDFEYITGTSIVISNKCGYEKIRELLIKEKRVPEDKIIIFEFLYEQSWENRYFEPEWLKKYPMENQIFMDLGCYDGIDAVRALNFFGEKGSVYAVEPDKENFAVCKKKLEPYHNILLLNQGVGKKREKRFFVEGGEGARFSEEGDVLVEIDTIDHMAGEKAVGFIKMDIEGYEEEALIGGAETIKRCKPVLAICIYHKKTDIWRIPLAILKLNANYRFYLGHYTLNWGDTVLYAVDPETLL